MTHKVCLLVISLPYEGYEPAFIVRKIDGGVTSDVSLTLSELRWLSITSIKALMDKKPTVHELETEYPDFITEKDNG